MATFIIYVIRWAVALTLLYSFFGLFLKRETLHSFNRMVLLIILVASIMAPLCQFETSRDNIVYEGRDMIESQIRQSLTPAPSPARLEETLARARRGEGSDYSQQQEPFTPLPRSEGLWVGILVLVYLLGLAYCGLRYLWAMAMLLRLIRQGKRVELDGLPKGVRVITHPAIKTPCSWMRWILLNPSDVNTRPIIEHELAHVRLGHSWDMLLCELTCRMLWPLPFAWMLRQDLRDVHEYQADRRVLRSDINDEEYQLLLIKKATHVGLQPVVSALNQSPIKRRFTMMYRHPSSRWLALKAVYLVPMAAIALTAFARPKLVEEIKQELQTTEEQAVETLMEAAKPAENVIAATPAETVQPPETPEPTDEPTEVPQAVPPADEPPTTADNTTPVYNSMPESQYENVPYNGIVVRRSDDCTRVICIATCESNDEHFKVGGSENQTFIEDVETGDHYKLRGVEGDLVPIGGNGFHVQGMKDRTFAVTLVFPPLPASVKYIRFWHLNSWNPTANRLFKLKDIEEK